MALADSRAALFDLSHPTFRLRISQGKVGRARLSLDAAGDSSGDGECASKDRGAFQWRAVERPSECQRARASNAIGLDVCAPACCRFQRALNIFGAKLRRSTHKMRAKIERQVGRLRAAAAMMRARARARGGSNNDGRQDVEPAGRRRATSASSDAAI